MGKKTIIIEKLNIQVKNLFDQLKSARVIYKKFGITWVTAQQISQELSIYNIVIKNYNKVDINKLDHKNNICRVSYA